MFKVTLQIELALLSMVTEFEIFGPILSESSKNECLPLQRLKRLYLLLCDVIGSSNFPGQFKKFYWFKTFILKTRAITCRETKRKVIRITPITIDEELLCKQ